MDTITVHPGADLTTVIERFAPSPQNEGPSGDEFRIRNTPPDLTADSTPTPATEAALTYLQSTLIHTPGFRAAALLQGQGGEVALYSQWETSGPDLEVRPEWSLRPGLAGMALIDARTFDVDFTAPAEQTEFSLKATPKAHFGVFTMPASAQEQLLEKARASAPNSIGTTGLEAINFHRSRDGGEVINFGAWSTFDGFRELFSRPGFADNGKWYEGLANFRNYFFTVIAVIGESGTESPS